MRRALVEPAAFQRVLFGAAARGRRRRGRRRRRWGWRRRGRRSRSELPAAKCVEDAVSDASERPAVRGLEGAPATLETLPCVLPVVARCCLGGRSAGERTDPDDRRDEERCRAPPAPIRSSCLSLPHVDPPSNVYGVIQVGNRSRRHPPSGCLKRGKLLRVPSLRGQSGSSSSPEMSTGPATRTCGTKTKPRASSPRCFWRSR